MQDMEQIVNYLIEHGITISTMESCTAGLLASSITDYEGSSAVFQGAFVTYSNKAKVMQGVPSEVIAQYGVYSSEVAECMAQACRRAYQAEIGIGVTGTTGNTDPNNADSVPGEVFYVILWGDRKKSCRLELDTAGLTRHEIKEQIVQKIVDSLREMTA